MAYQAVITIENKTGDDYSSWADFASVYHAGGSGTFWAEKWRTAGQAAGKSADELNALADYFENPVETVTWNNGTQTATKTSTIPTKAIWDLVEELRPAVTASYDDGKVVRTVVSHGAV